MAHIFLSYASEDRVRAREIAADLEALGWAVWWDHKLQAGKTFAGVIESEIKKSDCVLVLWSKASITSRWVRDEANEGLERGILVPVLIDAVEPPMGFRSIHAANLIGYDGDQSSPGFRQLVSDLRALLTPGAPAPVQRRTAIHTHRGGTGADWRAWLLRLGLAALGVAIVAVGTFGVMRYFDNFDHRAAELESRQKAFDEARRRTEEEAAKRQAELDAKQRSLDEKARATAAEAARRVEEEDKRREDQRKEDQRRTAQADAERARATAEAARKAEEAKQKQALKTPPKPVAAPAPAPQAALAPAAPAAPAPAPAAEAPKPPAAEPVAPKVAVAARSPLLPSPSDTWSYRYVDGFRRAEVARLTYRVDAVSETGIGELLRVSNRPDYQSRIVVARVPSFAGHPGLDYAPPDLAPYLQAFYRLDDGATLPTVKRQFSSDATVEMSMRIVGREQVTVPAGTFNAIKVVAEGRGSTFINRFPIHSIVTIWYAPEAKRFVKFDARTYERNMPQELAVFELVDYKLAR